MKRTIEPHHLQVFGVLFTAAVAVGALIGLVGFGPAGTDAGARIGALVALGIWTFGIWLRRDQTRERMPVTVPSTDA